MTDSPNARGCPGIDAKPCGRALQGDEVRCPSCDRSRQSFWKQAAAISVTVAASVATVVLAVIKKR